jgi:amino-acid N-acetyltransferase
MIESITYRFADSNDLSAISALLENSKLPISDIKPGKIDFIIASNAEDKIIGCIGIESYGAEGLLRSFAVDAENRNSNIGAALLDRLLLKAQQSGIETLHLLTTTAEKYFLKKGFSIAMREDAPQSIRNTIEFSSLCPSSSVYMLQIINH